MTNTLNTKAHTDIKRLPWIEGLIPVRLRPYAYLMRLDRPIGIWLLLLPGLWSITLASSGIHGFTANTFKVIALFTIGAIIMRGAGCVINDLWDRDLDKLVARTKSRPIASGAISTKQGVVFLATLLLIASIILIQFDPTTITLGIATLPLMAAYPLMKRITWWPQAFLGLTFNFSALMGWSAVTGTLHLPALLLYAGGIFWTIGYDTIYASQDKEDDAMAGIKSTARLFQNNSKKWVSLFYTLGLLSITAAIITSKGITLSLPLLCLPLIHLIWQIKKWKPDNHASSLFIFKSNHAYGILILISLLF